MIAVIFEVLPHAEYRQTYLDSAAALRPHLEAVDEFLPIERFGSLSQPGKVLSLSFWRDEAAVAHWRSGASWRFTAWPRWRGVITSLPTTACVWRMCCGTMV
jgi:heme-degrading monooxygenase HmoA